MPQGGRLHLLGPPAEEFIATLQDTIQLQTQLLEAQELIVSQSEMLEHQVRVAAQPEGPPGVRPRSQGLMNQLHRWPAQWGLEDKRLGRVSGRCR
jgi:hypothetical protein